MAPERVTQARMLSQLGDSSVRYHEIQALDSPFVDRLNIRFVLSHEPLDPALLEKARFKAWPRSHRNFVYENTKVRPRFYLVNRIRSVAGMEEAKAAMQSADVVEHALACSPDPTAQGKQVRTPLATNRSTSAARSRNREASLPGHFRNELPRLARLRRRPSSAHLLHQHRLPWPRRPRRTPHRHHALRARDPLARRRPEFRLLGQVSPRYH